MYEMIAYIGTKLIKATPMTRLHYNIFRGWDLPDDENGDDKGYLVEYTDGGEPNTNDYDGYVSWSPKEQFDNAYKKTNGLPFGLAVDAAKLGFRIARNGWNGTGMFAFFVPSSVFKVNRAPLLGIFDEGTEIKYRAHMDLVAADGTVGTWSPSNSDTLATDWYIVE